jgi:hypothetical protein
MPYRRLPNTDAARLRAMKTALKKGKEIPPSQIAYPAKIIIRLENFLQLFEQNLQLQKQALDSQNIQWYDYTDLTRKAKIYLSHFVRVMNMAIYRGDLPRETREYYGLAINESTIPPMNNENALIKWGRRIIDGEEQRLHNGGSPVTNPTIAVVKVRFESFLEASNIRNVLIKKTHRYIEKTAELRREADELILHIWNEVEAALSHLPENIRKKECEEYGLIYFYRKSEQSKAEKEEILDTVLNHKLS